MRKSKVPQICSYQRKNARKSTCLEFSRLRPKIALKLKGSDMGMPLTKMQENPQSSTRFSFGLKRQENRLLL